MNARRGPRKGVAGLPTAPLHTHQGSPGLLSGSACAPGLDDVAAQALEQPAWWPRLAALAVQDASGTPWAGYWQARARLLAEPAQARQGLLAAHAVAAKARELGAAHLQFSVELLASRAQALGSAGTEAADASLARALALAEQNDYRSTEGWWQPAWAAERLARAPTLGLASGPARRLARHWRLPGPDIRLADWPWVLKLRLFGPFHAWVHDSALAGRRRAAGRRRPAGPGPRPGAGR